MFQFLHKHSIPWILKWHYGTHTINTVHNQAFTYLSQEIQCKWWDKFDVDSIDITIPSTPSKHTEINQSKHPAEFSPPQEFPPLPKTYKEASLTSQLQKASAKSSAASHFDLAQTIIQQLHESFHQNFQQMQDHFDERFKQFEAKYSTPSRTHSDTYSAHSAYSIDL
ncbi:hypothetical protein Syun_024300 [Stephania yunnanensis]|uniref:Uncharacterized protein n=1 Tax=Stephania yunnanensis TaxID=152371 RepID=A0AAP0I444_9MAGN